MKEIIKILPSEIWQILEKNQNELEEIRIRNEKPLSVRIAGKTKKISDYRPSYREIQQILGKSMEFSIHSYINELKNGFITIKNGHRIGVCGEAVFDGNNIVNFKNISSINIRVARQKINFDEHILHNILDKSVLVISPPNLGKTTLLREICKFLSSKSCNLSVIDERFEISPRCYLGDNVDVLLGVSKKQGAWLMLKSMSPDYIVLDEITSDVEVLQEISSCGVKIIASIHAKDLQQIANHKKHILYHFDAVLEIHLEENRRKYVLKGSEDYV